MFDVRPKTTAQSGLSLAAGAALLALAWAPFAEAAESTSWGQFEYNPGHSGYNSGEHEITPKNVSKLANIGQFGAGNGSPQTQPVISGGILYMQTNYTLYAYTLSTGAQLWSVSTPNFANGSYGMLVSGSRVILNCLVTDTAAGLCAFDATSGKLLWSWSLGTGSPFTQPATDGTNVYVGESNAAGGAEALVALNLKTGALKWNVSDCTEVCEEFAAFNAPTVDSGVVSIGCNGTSGLNITVEGVCGFSASTGAMLWQLQLGGTGIGDTSGNVMAHGGTLYAAYRTAVCNQCGYNIDVTAIDESTGKTLWDTPLATSQSYYLYQGPPTLGPDGAVYETINTYNDSTLPNLYALNSKGTLKWSLSTPMSLFASPTTIGEVRKYLLFFTTGGPNTGTSVALSSRNGSQLWTSSDNYLVTKFPPLVTGGVVYNDCNDNYICAYKP